MDWAKEHKNLVKLIKANQLGEAQALCLNLVASQMSLGEDINQLYVANLYDVLSLAFYKDSQFREAELYTQKALQIYSALSIPDYDEQITGAQTRAAICLSELKFYDAAEEMFMKAWSSLVRDEKPRHQEIALLTERIALLYQQTNRFPKAVEYYEAAINARSNARDDLPTIGTSHRQLGVLFLGNGQIANAIAQLEKSILLYRRAGLTPDDSRLIAAQLDLAAAYLMLGEYSKSMASVNELLAKSNAKEWSISDEDLSAVYEKKATAEAVQGNFSQAALDLQCAIDALSRNEKLDASQIASLNRKLADIKIEERDHLSAQKYLEKAISLLDKANQKTIDKAGYHQRLAFLMIELNDQSSALCHFQQAIDIISRAYGTDHPSLLLLKVEVAEALIKSELFGDALQEYLDVLEQLPGEELILYLDKSSVLERIANIYLVMNDDEKAADHFKRALDFKISWFGPGHPGVADLESKLGNLYLRTGKRDDALNLYARALAAYETTFGADHPDAVDVTKKLAKIDK
ncbi:MAG: tetratricopeptide repeat protein [Cyanobacteria bacterium SZAS-4]|nr:tetratricopeptide repeat protein [Cyanobacteria bacterium SZAS-4]